MASVLMRRRARARALSETRTNFKSRRYKKKPKASPRLYLLNAVQSGEETEKKR